MSSVDPVVRLLADLDRPARPTVEFHDALLARLLGGLEGAIRPDEEAHASDRIHGRGSSILRPLRRRRGRVVLAIAVLAGAAVAALFVSTPWKTAPGFLEQVQAALTPPEGTVLHYRWEETRTAKDFECTVTEGPGEIWIDQAPPHKYRVLLSENDLPLGSGRADLRAFACSGGTPVELGGTFDADSARRGQTLRFEPPNTLSVSAPYGPNAIDPVADLRDALSSGRAHDEGSTELDGRTVERIRFDPPSDCPQSICPRAYAYVDPQTFYLVQTECEDCGYIAHRGRFIRFSYVTRFVTYEYLPRTEENLALTDIRKQHPDATGPPEVQPIHDLPTLRGAVAKTVRTAEGAKSAPVTFEVTATDDAGVAIPVSCQPVSGSRFPLGETSVFCEATDSHGNTNTAEFTVTVKRAR